MAIVDGRLVNFLLPLFEFGLVDLVAIRSSISVLVPATVLMVVFATTFSSLVVVVVITAAVPIVLMWSVPGRILAAPSSTSPSVRCSCAIANIGVRVIC